MRKPRIVRRLVVVTLPDGTLDRVPMHFLDDGSGILLPVDAVQAAAEAAERPAYRTLTPRKRRGKAPSGAPANVVGRVKLSAADLAGVRR